MTLVNAVGMACPLPVIKAKKAAEALTEGGTVQVLVDNEIAVQNLGKLAAQKHCGFASEKTETGFSVTLTVPAAAVSAAGEETGLPVTACGPAGPTVVAVGSRCMGSGDDALGSLLLRGFLFALTKLERLPDTILFYNSGAFLTCEGSESLEDLKAMAAAGVEILTCGTCLNHYGLTEKLAVGAVTNMYEITEKQALAGRLLRP